MKAYILAIIFAILAFTTPVQAEVLTLEQTMAAGVRVTAVSGASRGMGSGTVVNQAQGKYFILTNGHVIGGAREAYVEFFVDGFKSRGIPAAIEYRHYLEGSTVDVAVLSVPETVFAGSALKPRVIYIAPSSFRSKEGDKVGGVACPAGQWLMGWAGRIIRTRENTISFNMPSVGGQSGSGVLANIINEQGKEETRLVGMLSWRIGDGSNSTYGAAISCPRLYEIFSGRAQRDAIDTNWRVYPTADVTGLTPNAVCDQCGKKLSEHRGIYNTQTKKWDRDKDGTIYIAHPDSKKLKSLTQYEYSYPYGDSGCPPWGCQPPYRHPQQPYQNNPYNPYQGQQPPFGNGPGGNVPPIFPGVPSEPPVQPPVNPPTEPPVEDNRDEIIAKQDAAIKELEGKIKVLQDSNAGFDGQIKVFEEKLAQLQAERDALVEDSTVKDGIIAEKDAIVQAKQAELEKAVGEIEEEKKDKQAVQDLLGITKAENEDLQDSVHVMTDKATELNNENAGLKGKLKDLEAQVAEKVKEKAFTWIDAVTGEDSKSAWAQWGIRGLIALLATFLWTKYGFPYLLKNTTTKLPAWVADRIVKKKLKKILKPSDTPSTDVYNKVEPQPKVDKEQEKEELFPNPPVTAGGAKNRVTNTNVVENNVLVNIEYPNDLAKQLIQQEEAQQDCDALNKWCILYELYCEAMKRLETGDLFLTKESKLLSSKHAAEKINEYVDNVLMRKIEAGFKPDNAGCNPYHKAYKGKLYKEAIDKLAANDLDGSLVAIINAKEVVQAVERYVTKRFLERIYNRKS